MRIPAALLRGRLSDEERALVTYTDAAVERAHEAPPPDAPPSRESLETLLYMHLSTAARARLRMESARSWGTEYHADYRTRELALAQATRHLGALRSMGDGTVDALLLQMALTEGITP